MTTNLQREKIAVFTCKICGCKCSLEDRGKYWRWCGEHGLGGSKHGIIDSFLRMVGVRKYQEHYFEDSI